MGRGAGLLLPGWRSGVVLAAFVMDRSSRCGCVRRAIIWTGALSGDGLACSLQILGWARKVLSKFRRICLVNFATIDSGLLAEPGVIPPLVSTLAKRFLDFSSIRRHNSRDTQGATCRQRKKELQESGCLNPSVADVRDARFEQMDFFDPFDLVQVKYEMLRRVQTEEGSVVEAARDFGYSRPAYYRAKDEFERAGLPGLIPKKRGPERRPQAHRRGGRVFAAHHRVGTGSWLRRFGVSDQERIRRHGARSQRRAST